MTGISVKFRMGKDDDIREWWENEPDRAYLLRLWIREKIHQKETVVHVEPSIPFSPQPLKKIETSAEDIDLMSQF